MKNFFPRPDLRKWLRLAAAPDPVPQGAGCLSASCDGTQGNNVLGVPCSLTRPKTKGYGETCWCFVHSSVVWCTPHAGEHLTQSERTSKPTTVQTAAPSSLHFIFVANKKTELHAM